MSLILDQRRIIVLIFTLFLGSINLVAQNPQAYRHTVTPEFKMDFYILLDAKKIKYKDTLEYTWFKSQKIQSTQGRSAGQVLHGNFSKFYINGQLAEQGNYVYGLKDGEWRTWDVNGDLLTIQTYKAGVLSGHFRTYEEGQINEEGHFKRGKKKLNRRYRVKEIKDESRDLDSLENNEKKHFFKFRNSEKNEDSDTEVEPENEDGEPWYKRLLNRIDKGEKEPKEKRSKDDKNADKSSDPKGEKDKAREKKEKEKKPKEEKEEKPKQEKEKPASKKQS